MVDDTYRGTETACGTNRGYNRHWHKGEIACTRCLIAHAAYAAERYRAKTGNPPRVKRHCKRGKPLCDECRETYNAYRRKHRAEKKGTTT